MTLAERLKAEIAQSLTEETAGFRVEFEGGETKVIISDNDPALEREIGDGTGVKVTKVQTAEAGCGR